MSKLGDAVSTISSSITNFSEGGIVFSSFSKFSNTITRQGVGRKFYRDDTTPGPLSPSQLILMNTKTPGRVIIA